MPDEFELDKVVMSSLSRLGFKAKSYLRYEDHSDIFGEFRPTAPFTIPTRTMVEISRVIPDFATIDGFYNQAKNAQCEKTILILQDPAKLDRESKTLASKYGIEIWSSIELMSKASLSEADLQQAKETLDAVATPTLIRALPQLARQVIPTDISKAINDPQRKAWEVFEDAVYASFQSCLNYKVRKLGRDSRFQSEPEGVVVTSGLPAERFAFIYDCKSSQNKYAVDSKDESTFVKYIQEKKSEVLAIDKCELKYFVIIGPRFGGDMMQRRQYILEKTQVITVYLTASALKSLAEWALKINDPDLKQLIDLREIFKLSEPEVNERAVASYIEEFDAKNRTRY